MRREFSKAGELAMAIQEIFSETWCSGRDCCRDRTGFLHRVAGGVGNGYRDSIGAWLSCLWVSVRFRLPERLVPCGRRRPAWRGFSGQHRRQTVDPRSGIAAGRRISIFAAEVG